MTSRFSASEQIEDFEENSADLTKGLVSRSVRWGMLDVVFAPDRLAAAAAAEICLVAAALWLRTGLWFVIAWAGAALALLGVQTGLRLAYRRNSDAVGIEAWEWRLAAVAWTTAAAWGCLGFLVATSADVFVQFVALAALERSMSSAVASTSAQLRAALGQVYITTAAICGAILARWDASYAVIGVLAALQAVVLHRRISIAREQSLSIFSMKERAAVKDMQLDRMTAKLTQFLTVDSLTKLMNRRGFDTVMRKEWSRGINEHSPVSLLMIAFDDFKGYVSEAGAAAGEDALQRIADAVLIELRCPRDVVARIGNAEIGVLLPQTDRLGAKATAERIAAAMTALDIARPGGGGTLTVSVGAATMVPTGEVLPAVLLQNADGALNRARAIGASVSVWGMASEADEALIARDTQSGIGARQTVDGAPAINEPPETDAASAGRMVPTAAMGDAA